MTDEDIFSYMMTKDDCSPPPACFSCGNELPEKDYDLFHKCVENLIKKGEKESNAQKKVLDGSLSKPYIRDCCRLMFIGDPLEYRKMSEPYYQ